MLFPVFIYLKIPVSNTHDFVGNVTRTKVRQSVDGQSYEYDKRFDFDNQGRLLSIRQQIAGDSNGEVTLAAYTYDDMGAPASKAIHNAQETETYARDLTGRTTAVSSPSFSYALDYEQTAIPGATPRLDGNVSALRWGNSATPDKAYAYTYDPTGQLAAADYKTAAAGTWNASEAFAEKNLSYDRHGNILSLLRNNAAGTPLHALSEPVYDGNKLISVKVNGTQTAAYAYDDAGNMTTDGRRGVNITYNVLNLPETVVAGDQKVSYIYDAAGQKLASNANGSLTYYRSVMVYGNDNKLLYILHPEGTVSRNEGSAGTSYTYNYFKRDQVGSTRVMLSAIGGTLQVQQSTDYYPFGLSHENSNLHRNKYLFSGKELQDGEVGGQILGLYDFGARQYDALIGRWITQDPAKQFFSPYVYCANNPISLIDPFGLEAGAPGLGDTSVYTSQEFICYGFGYRNVAATESYVAPQSPAYVSPLADQVPKPGDESNNNMPEGDNNSGGGGSGKFIDGIMTILEESIKKLPSNRRAMKLHKQGRFSANYQGNLAEWSTQFKGNQYVPSWLVQQESAKFMTQIKGLQILQYGGWVTNAASTIFTIDALRNSTSFEQRFSAGADLFMGVLGFTPIGMPTSVAYSLSDPIRTQWEQQALRPQINNVIQTGDVHGFGNMMIGIMPFK